MAQLPPSPILPIRKAKNLSSFSPLSLENSTSLAYTSPTVMDEAAKNSFSLTPETKLIGRENVPREALRQLLVTKRVVMQRAASLRGGKDLQYAFMLAVSEKSTTAPIAYRVE